MQNLSHVSRKPIRRLKVELKRKNSVNNNVNNHVLSLFGVIMYDNVRLSLASVTADL